MSGVRYRCDAITMVKFSSGYKDTRTDFGLRIPNQTDR